MLSRWACFSLGLIALVAAALRFSWLDAKSLWLDEALSWRLQDFGLERVIQRTGESSTTHPPLYFAVLRLWTSCFGDSEYALRSMAAAAGVLTIPAMFLLGRELIEYAPWGKHKGDWATGTWTGLLASALVACSAFHVALSRQVRGYSLGLLLYALSSWFLLRALRPARARVAAYPWIGYSVTALALCYTHNLAIVSVAAQGAFAVQYLWFRRSRQRLPTIAARSRTGAFLEQRADEQRSGRSDEAVVHWRWGLGAAAVIVAGYLPWVPHVWSQSEGVRNSWDSPSDIEACAREICTALVATPFSPRADSMGIAGGVSVIATVVVMYVAWRGGSAGIFLALNTLIPVCVILVYSAFSARSVFSARYLAFAQLPLLASFALAMSSISWGVARWLVTAPLLLWAVFSCYNNWDLVGPCHEPGMRGAMKYVLQRRTSDEPIVAQTPFTFFQMLYYLRGVTRPVLCVAHGDRHVQRGAAHLLDADLVTATELLASQPVGMWLATTDSYDVFAQVAIPLDGLWQQLEEQTFAQDWFWEGPIVVRHFRLASTPRSSADCPMRTSAMETLSVRGSLCHGTTSEDASNSVASPGG